MAIVTIGRQLGSGGEEIAAKVAEATGFLPVDRELLERWVKEHGLTGPDLDESDEDPASPRGAGQAVHVDLIEAVLLDRAAKADLVVIGRGGQFVFRGCPAALRVRVFAPREYRALRVAETEGVDRESALGLVEASDRERAAYLRERYHEDWEDPAHYDLVVRTDSLGIEVAAQVILRAIEAAGIRDRGRELAEWLEARTQGEGGPGRGEMPTPFVNASEVELARVLDFYQIRWKYEPRSFPLARDEKGRVTEAFTPDFYLPDLNLYLELTVLKQSLVTDKNRKIRRFRELYPDVRLKVFYGRDFRSLVQKYGLGATLSGGTGR
jgi:cytidylate kinase